MPKIRKKTSKRGTTRLRERIKHKSAEAKKKAKRASKNDVTWKSRVKKDPGVPKLFPYRDELIAEQQKVKEQVSRLAQQPRTTLNQLQRELDKKRKATNQEADDTTASTSAAALAEAVQANGDEGFEDVTSSDEDGTDLPVDQALSSSASLRAFARSLRKVLSLSDVLIEVLDARDPLGTRSVQLEREATQQGKKVVLVLNKIDLVPKETVEAWLAYLRRSWPTLPFRSSTQLQRQNLSSRGGHTVGEGSTAATSTQPLMQLLKNYARNPRSSTDTSGPSIKTSITVGVIGFPNVGKSSLINTLKRSRACGVAPTPGYTKEVQEVAIEKGLKVLDCPGVVLDVGEGSDGAAERVLRNAVKVEQVADPLGPVAVILRRCRPEHLMMLYSIPAFSSAGQTVDERTKEFLIQVARVRGRVKKGGVPDVVSAARAVLRDWNMGKIPYYTVPPPLPVGEPAFTPAQTQGRAEDAMQTDDQDVGSAKIVTELAPAFDLDALFAAADGSALTGLKGRKDVGPVVRMEAMADEGAQVKLLGEEEAADVDDEMVEAALASGATKPPPAETETVSLPPKKPKRVAFEAPAADEDDELGIGQNRAIARQAKKDKKRKAKAVAREMREQADEDMAETDDRPYSFSEFFASAH